MSHERFFLFRIPVWSNKQEIFWEKGVRIEICTLFNVAKRMRLSISRRRPKLSTCIRCFPLSGKMPWQYLSVPPDASFGCFIITTEQQCTCPCAIHFLNSVCFDVLLVLKSFSVEYWFLSKIMSIYLATLSIDLLLVTRSKEISRMIFNEIYFRWCPFEWNLYASFLYCVVCRKIRRKVK